MITTNPTEHRTCTEASLIVDILTEPVGKLQIDVAAHTTCTYLLIAGEAAQIDLDIMSLGVHADIEVVVLCVAKKESDIALRVHSHLMHDHARANMHMITMLAEDADATIDGGVDIHPHVKKVAGHLLEENIILGDRVQIKTLPMLDVRSDDVSASHGARIERLDSKKLFYLQSRGLDATQAKELMITGYFEQAFAAARALDADDTIAQLQSERLAYLLEG